MEKNFNNCSFKLSVPALIEAKEEYIVSFQILGKVGGVDTKIILVDLKMQDRLNHNLVNSNKQFFEIKGGDSRYKVTVTLKRNGQNCLLAGADLIATFLDQINKRRIIVHYKMQSLDKCSLNGIEYINALEVEMESLKEMSNRQCDIRLSDEIGSEMISRSQIAAKSENPFIAKYRNALIKEINYLKTNGGRQYRVTNGKLLSEKVGEYAYIFELETELHLADAAPIRVRYQNSEANGEVLVCEDFSIIVILKQHIGHQLPVAYITVEPWKLLKALYDKLGEFNEVGGNRIANLLVQKGPHLCEGRPLEDIKKGPNEAMLHAHKEPITIIWGPPGTGKTYTMSKLAIQFQKKAKKVLIVSHSNVSVDGVIKKIVERIEENKEEHLLAQGKVLRYGYVRDEELAKHQLATSFNYCINKFPELYKKKEALETEKLELKMGGRLYSTRGIEIEKEIQKLRLQLKESEKEVIKRADIVATTISKIAVDQVFERVKYDVVMFDEVSMAYVPQVFMAACVAKHHFICVGDFRQLPPIAQSDYKKQLEEDIFSFLGIVDKIGTISYHPWLVMLYLQRRMHPEISRFASHFIYSDLLKTEKRAAEQVQLITDREPFSKQPLIQVDLTGTYCAASKNSDNSRFNILSAFIAFQMALDSEKTGKHQVGIITPYALQMRLIKAMIQDYRQHKQTQIVCSTIHQFQGSEKEVIIFDAIESYPFKQPGVLLDKNEDNRVTRLVNVAVTRAKGKLITISHNRFWENKLDNKAHPLYRLLKYEQKYGYVITEEELGHYLKSKTYVPIRYFDQDMYISHLIKDLNSAKERIRVSLPTGHLVAHVKELEQAISAAIKRGINVGIKCKDYENLPSEWKVFSVQDEKAIFPLIIIDGNITWYGVPEARMLFEDKNNKYLSIYTIIVRFKGKHTTDMIQNITELDEVIVSASDKPFINSNNKVINQSVGSKTRLIDFIEENYRCKECKSPLTLKKGRSGKSYIGCSKCQHMEYLTPELVNHYIMMNQVMCLKHNQLLEARLGQYGVYIQCTCQDERHYLKPSEI